VEYFERFQQSRCVIEDFTSRTLAAIPSDFGRLYYVSSLKDAAGGRYRHDGLVEVYSESSVQEALESCHEELFSRLLLTIKNVIYASVLIPQARGLGSLWKLGGKRGPFGACVRRDCPVT
jgi:hypothetical protein